MKRSIGSLFLAMVAVGAFAQANFTIVRPVDGARVREKVKILFPKGSIPPGGYVGIFLDGQLIDALVPPVVGKYHEYVLDTKERGLADTAPGKPAKLEAKLYVDYNNSARVTKTSSIDLTIGNKANIQVPNQGLKLRYRFNPGTEMVYDLKQQVAVDTISESENKKGGKAAELPLDTESFRLLYAVDNAYGNGEGLMRIQAMPDKGKDYAVLTVAGSTTPSKFYDYMMTSIYMRLTSTGKEVFGSIPAYYALEGTTGEGNSLDLFAAFPLPTLPEKAIRPGDAWQSRFQSGKIDLSKLFDQTSVVKTFPARGEFLTTEWEMGHPCAVIKNTISESEMSVEDKKLLKAGSSFGGDKVKLDETIWFALDTRQIVKIVRDETLETKVESAGGGFGPGGGGMGGPMGPGGPSGGPRGAGMPGGGGGRMGGNKGEDIIVDSPTNINQRGFGKGRGGPMGGPQGGRGGPGFGGNFPGGPGGAGGFGRGGAPTSQASYVRLRILLTFTLEK